MYASNYSPTILVGDQSRRMKTAKFRLNIDFVLANMLFTPPKSLFMKNGIWMTVTIVHNKIGKIQI